MAGSLNQVQLIGNLGADPDVKTTQTGKLIVNLSLATSDTWRDKNTGERKEKTEWHRVVIFNEGLAGVAEQYLRKGTKVFIEGKLQTRKWTDQSGVEKYTTEVVLENFRGQLIMLGGRSGGGGGDDDFGTNEGRASSSSRSSGGRGNNNRRHNDMDDDIPF